MKTLFKLVGFGVVIGLAAAITTKILYKTILAKDSAYISSGIAAFMGAAAVFVFTLLLQFIGKFIERRKRDFRALIFSQYDLNMFLNMIQENRSLVNDAVEHYKKHEFFGLSFSYFPVDHKTLLSFRNLGLIEDYSQLNTSLRRHNQDYKISAKIYDDIHHALVAKVLSTAEKDENYKGLISRLDYLNGKLDELEEEVFQVLGVVTDLAEKSVPLMNLLHTRRYSKNYRSKLQPRIDLIKKQTITEPGPAGKG